MVVEEAAGGLKVRQCTPSRLQDRCWIFIKIIKKCSALSKELQLFLKSVGHGLTLPRLPLFNVEWH